MKLGQWDDLNARVVSGVAMALVGLIAVLAGGVWFQMLGVFAAAILVWELWTMIAPERPIPGMLLAAAVASILSGAFSADGIYLLAFFVVPPLIGAAALRRERLTFAAFALLIIVSAWGLVEFRNTHGMLWIFWLILVVVITDIAGYFAGRLIGGPKFWPKVSPKKTWAGTLAGWIGAALLGWAFIGFTTSGKDLIWISALVAFASQMGDIAESALKRRMGVKDSSALIPGHGGVFDRFDGLLAASLVMLITAQLTDVPEIAW